MARFNKSPRVMMPPAQLRIATGYALHPPGAIERLAQQIKQSGVMVPIVVDHARVIQSGMSLWLAARHLGLREVPVVLLDRRRRRGRA